MAEEKKIKYPVISIAFAGIKGEEVRKLFEEGKMRFFVSEVEITKENLEITKKRVGIKEPDKLSEEEPTEELEPAPEAEPEPEQEAGEHPDDAQEEGGKAEEVDEK